jgi:hypothetical protein
MNMLAGCYLVALHFLGLGCRLELEDLVKDRWMPDDGVTIRPDSQLNLLPGIHARDHGVHIKKMLLSPRTSMDETPSRIWMLDPGFKHYDRFYLERPNDELLADFDSILIYFFQFGYADDTREVAFPAFLASLGRRDRAIKLLAACMATALGNRRKRSIGEIMEESNMGKSRKEWHEKRIQVLFEYLDRWEEPYNKNGNVFIYRYANSKFLLLHMFLACYLNKGEVDQFYNELYHLLDKEFRKIFYISSSEDRYTTYEKILLENHRSIKNMMNKCKHYPWHNSLDGDHILNLLRFLLYNDKEKRFLLGHIPSAKEELRQFFEAHSEFREYEGEEEAWKEVLGILDDPEIVYEDPGRRIEAGIYNLLRVLCSLCGVNLDYLDVKFGDANGRENIKECISYLLSRICCHEQSIEVGEPATFRETKIAHAGKTRIEAFGEFCIRFYFSNDSWVELSLHCSEEKSRLVATSCDCIRHTSPFDDEGVNNLPDFVIRHMKYEENVFTGLRKLPNVIADSSIFFFSDLFFGAKDVLRRRFVLRVLDSVAFVMEEQISAELRSIRERAEGIISAQFMSNVIKAYAACWKHVFTADRSELDGLNEEFLEELMREKNLLYNCENLIIHIAKNVSEEIMKRLSKGGLRGMLKAIAYSGDLQTLKLFVRKALDGQPFRDELLVQLVGEIPRHRVLLRFVFEEVDTGVLIANGSKEFYWSSFSNLFGDICIEMAGQENANFNTVVKRAYDWLFSTHRKYGQSKASLLLRLLQHTYRRFDDPGVLYDYVLRAAADEDGHRAAFFLLRFLKQEGLYIPHGMYRGLWKFFNFLDGEARTYFRKRIKLLASELKRAKLLVKKDALSKKRIASLIEKNPMNRAIISPNSSEGMPKKFNNRTFKNTYKRLKKYSGLRCTKL